MGDDSVINYVALRADEGRQGFISHKSNIKTVYPFREDGLVRRDIIRILEESGLGLPFYMEWGRTRSGCFFCFYQQKIEWVRLKERYPELFEQAKQYEYANQINGEPFYWSNDEPLAELERPERMEEIKRNWEKSRLRANETSSGSKLLVHILGGHDVDEDGEKEGCLICHV